MSISPSSYPDEGDKGVHPEAMMLVLCPNSSSGDIMAIIIEVVITIVR